MPRMRRLSLVLLLSVIGCGDDGRRGGSGTPTSDAGDGDSGGPGLGPDSPMDTCDDGRSRWVYVLDSDETLLRFEPDALRFTAIGTVACDDESTPHSMAIDREANAWVLYKDGRIHQVSTEDASCTPTSYSPVQHDIQLFGMGFAAEGSGETLFIAGTPGGGTVVGGEDTMRRLGAIDPATLTLTLRGGTIIGTPELTGTGDGQLWGFFPGSAPTIRRLNKDTAAEELSIPVAAIEGEEALAWAFAFWGGRYYIFLKGISDESTNVYRLTPTTMESEEVLTDTGYTIVGAGVSTCAPLELI